MTHDELDELDETIFIEYFPNYVLVSTWHNNGKLRMFHIVERIH